MWEDLYELLLLSDATHLLNFLNSSPSCVFDAKREPKYPGKIYAWKYFENGVRSFTGPAVNEEERVAHDVDDVLHYSLDAKVHFGNDGGEGMYVFHQVLVSLQAAGWLKRGARTRHGCC